MSIRETPGVVPNAPAPHYLREQMHHDRQVGGAGPIGTLELEIPIVVTGGE